MTEQKIGRYEIKSELGRGGMATVYLAYDPMFEREVALKVLPREMLHDPQFRVRFEREAKVIARLEHAAIVPVYDVGDHDGQPYFVMRSMMGGALSDRMKAGPISLEETASILQRIGPALDYAHAKGIVHRDLKPGNILFDEADEPFISDFGIAKLEHSQTNLTGSGIIGTPAYMSPEQARGDEVDGRSDIYALGVILYEMLSGKPPFEANTPMGVVFKHVTEPIPHILDTNPDLPVAIEMVLEKAMAKEPARRIQNATTLALALGALVNGETPDMEVTIPAATRIKQSTTGSLRPVTGQLPTPPTPTAPLPAPSAPPAQKAFPLKLLLAGAGIGLVALIALVLVVLNFLTKPALSATATPPPATVVPQAQPVISQTATAVVEVTATANLPEGGADQIALISGNNLWVMEPDGSNLSQLTTDNQPKTNLAWLLDGSGLVYLQGKCVYTVELASQKIANLVCFKNANNFDSFQISPDGKQVALVVDRQLFVVPFEVKTLAAVSDGKGLAALGGCLAYNKAPVKSVLWSQDGKKVALLFLLGGGKVAAETIRVLDISRCSAGVPPILDEFPGERFIPEGYIDTKTLPSYAWDGNNLFLFNTFKRNDGFGELYLYDMGAGLAEKINPVAGQCCYRDARFSPDGKYMIFAYQDYSKGAESETQVYYLPLAQVGKNADFQPISLPAKFFPGAREKPQFAFRPVQP